MLLIIELTSGDELRARFLLDARRKSDGRAFGILCATFGCVFWRLPGGTTSGYVYLRAMVQGLFMFFYAATIRWHAPKEFIKLRTHIFPHAVCNNEAPPVLVDFQQGATSALVECSSLLDYKWWRSNSSCEPNSFTPYPNCTAQNCRIPLATLMVDFYMYFCCTSSNVSSLEGIQFQRCTQIQGE